MKPSHAIVLALIPFFTVAGAIAAIWSRRICDGLFFLMLSLTVLVERLDVNFFSEAWYRGTTRGIQISLAEILACCLLAGCLLGRREGPVRWFWPGSLGLMAACFLYAVVSVVISEPKLFGVFELSKMAGSILVFLATAAYVRTRREWTLLLVALGAAVGFEGLWAVKQHFLTHLGRAEGTLDHANSLSMYFCLTVPPLAAAAYAGWSRALRWFCAAAAALGAVGVVLTVSRAGIPVFALAVGGAIVACASWRLTPSRVAVRLGLLLAVAALVTASWAAMRQRYEEASLEEEYFDPTIDGRGIYLRLAKMIATDHFFGVGLNNWSYHVSRTYGKRLGFRFADYDYLTSIYGTEDVQLYADSYLAAPAHNLGALTLGELGVPGLVLFTLLWLRWFSLGAPFFRLPRGEPIRTMGVGLFFSVCGIFGQSLTEWVYRQPPILYTFYILLGALASLAAARKRGEIVGQAVGLAAVDDAGGPMPGQRLGRQQTEAIAAVEG